MNKPILYDCEGNLVSPKKTRFPWFTAVSLFVLLSMGMLAFGAMLRLSKDAAKPDLKASDLKASSVAVESPDSLLPYRGYQTPAEWPHKLASSCGNWAINYTSRDALMRRGALAQTEIEERRIWLPYDVPRQAEEEFLLHEIIHVALHCAGGMDTTLGDVGAEEEFVNPEAKQLIDILHRNPTVATWIEDRP